MKQGKVIHSKVMQYNKILPPFQKEGYTCAGRAFPKLARHGVAHRIVRVSEHQRVACPMKLLVELNSEIHIFLRKISLVIFSMIFQLSTFISHFGPYNANEVNTMSI